MFLTQYGERATPKEGAGIRRGSATNGRVGVTLRADAPPAHPFSEAFLSARRRLEKIEEQLFGILTVQG